MTRERRTRQHVDIRRSVDTPRWSDSPAVMSTTTVDDARAASMIFDAVRCHDAPPVRCIDAARASTPLPSTSRRPKTKANVRADNRVAVRRYRERRRTEEKERRTECERLRAENETLRLKLATIEAELKHSSWLLRVIAWKYDLDFTDIPTPTQKPSTAVAVVPLEEATGSDEKRLHATEEVNLPKKAARQSRIPKHAVHASIPQKSDLKLAAAPNELDFKHFLENYFTHGDTCPCYERVAGQDAAPLYADMCLPVENAT